MTDQPQDEPFSEAHLASPEYRERLMRKLNCLIAVLEVATAKVKRSMSAQDADVPRLSRIRTNLQSTLDVCLRARAALERREALPRELPENLEEVMRGELAERIGPKHADRRAPTPLETASEHERAKFEKLPPIARDELRTLDLERLIRDLQA